MMIETASIIAVILGVTQVIKTLGLPSKYAPLVSLVLGVGISLLVGGISTAEAFNGLVYGLSASGLFSGTKTVATKT